MRITRRLASSLVSVVAAATVLSGCTATSLQSQYENGDNKGYISGTGVTEIKPADRKEPVTFSGKTDQGSTFSTDAHKGDVVVVNFWYAGCPPCRLEAKSLQKLSTQYAGKGVDFVGVNTRDDKASADSFDSTFGVTYPSILDAQKGRVQLAFSGTYRPNATPTTIVLDKQGRVAARVEGPVNDQPSTVSTLIDSALAEKSPSASGTRSTDAPSAAAAELPSASGASVSFYGYDGCAPCRFARQQLDGAADALAPTGAAFDVTDVRALTMSPVDAPSSYPAILVRDAHGRTVTRIDGAAADQEALEAELRAALGQAAQR